MNWPPGAHASTFGGNPVSCAAALETIALLEEDLIENARIVGQYLKEQLQKLAIKYDEIGDIRGKGLMVAIELVRGGVADFPAPQLRDAIVDASFYKGLLLLGCGESSIRFCPPLIATQADIDTAIGVLSSVLRDVR